MADKHILIAEVAGSSATSLHFYKNTISRYTETNTKYFTISYTNVFFMFVIPSLLEYAVAQLIEVKSRKISDSIPNGVIEIIH